jgi:hypothetical protein
VYTVTCMEPASNNVNLGKRYVPNRDPIEKPVCAGQTTKRGRSRWMIALDNRISAPGGNGGMLAQSLSCHPGRHQRTDTRPHPVRLVVVTATGGSLLIPTLHIIKTKLALSSSSLVQPPWQVKMSVGTRRTHDGRQDPPVHVLIICLPNGDCPAVDYRQRKAIKNLGKIGAARTAARVSPQHIHSNKPEVLNDMRSTRSTFRTCTSSLSFRPSRL